MKNKVTWFEIPAPDFQKAKQFYETVFDWKVELRGNNGAMAHTTAVDKDQNTIEPGGINGGFSIRKAKDEFPSVVVQTKSIDKMLQAIEVGGGKVLTPKHSIGAWGSVAYFADPEGNVITLWEKPEKT